MQLKDFCTNCLFRCLTPLCVLFWITKGAADDKHPTFTDTPLNVTVLKGSEAVLRCGVENLGTKTVGWRKQPYNVPITIGKEQFLELDRFKLVRVLHSGEWNLHIKNAQPFDSGIYECQVSSRGDLMRRNVTLKVYENIDNTQKPDIRISGTQFVEKGASIHLTCNVSSRYTTSRQSLPKYLGWFKDGRRLETSASDDIYITQHVSVDDTTVISAVDILKARMTDTGVYVCLAAKNLATRIKVDVLNAETYNEKRDTRVGGSMVQQSWSGSAHLSSHQTVLRVFVFSIVTCKLFLELAAS